jgi:hypothetical protein
MTGPREEVRLIRILLALFLVEPAAMLFVRGVQLGTPASWLWRVAPFVALPIALAGIALCFRARGNIAAGIAAMAGMEVLYHRYTLVSEVSRQGFQQSGAVLFAWVLGMAIARLSRGSLGAGPAAEQREHEFGYRAALAALAATYVSAGLSKLRVGGIEWISSSTIRMMILSHTEMNEPFGIGALRTWLANSPRACVALQAWTVLLELSGIGLVFGWRIRMLCAMELLAMHVGIELASGIAFPQPRVMLLILGFPWETIVRRLRIALARQPAQTSP